MVLMEDEPPSSMGMGSVLGCSDSAAQPASLGSPEPGQGHARRLGQPGGRALLPCDGIELNMCPRSSDAAC